MLRPKLPSRERIYDFVRERLLNGDSPTVREVQKALGFRAVQSAQEHLEALVQEGRLKKREGRSRGYLLPQNESPTPSLFIPILGRVQAGALTTASEDHEGVVRVEKRPGLSSDERKLFALRVRGESMTGVGIFPNDIVVVQRQSTAVNGDIVVAIVGEEATVKTFHKSNKRVELWPENPEFQPIIPKSIEDMVILGKVIEVRRYLDGYMQFAPEI